MLAQSVCAGGRVAVLECDAEVDEEDCGIRGHGSGGISKQDVVWLDVTVDVVV